MLAQKIAIIQQNSVTDVELKYDTNKLTTYKIKANTDNIMFARFLEFFPMYTPYYIIFFQIFF